MKNKTDLVVCEVAKGANELRNKKLIAAAPEMLRVIETVLSNIDINWRDPNATRLREIDLILLDEVAKKARGEL